MEQFKITLIEELIMLSMLSGPRYGIEIIDAVEMASKGEMQLNIGALYPALGRLHKKGHIARVRHSQTTREETDARNYHSRSYYQLTPQGHEILKNLNRTRSRLSDYVSSALPGNEI